MKNKELIETKIDELKSIVSSTRDTDVNKKEYNELISIIETLQYKFYNFE